MSGRQKRFLIGLAVGWACIAAYVGASYFHRPQMSEADVIQAANAAAVNEGFLLNEYTAPSARFEFGDRDRTWTVMYSLRLPTPWESLPLPKSAHGAPRHFLVSVDDKTGRTRVAVLRQVGPAKPVKLPAGVKVLYTNQAAWHTN